MITITNMKRSRTQTTSSDESEQDDDEAINDNDIIDDDEEDKNIEKDIEKYAHGTTKFSTKKLKHKALRKTLEHLKSNIRENAIKTLNTEILLTQEHGFIQAENEYEKIYKIKQADISKNIDFNSTRNLYDFQLTKFGPYNINFSRNGRFLLFGGKKGHVATLDCLRTNIGTEIQLQEDVHSVCYLHNESLFAVAQKQYTYIYDHKGVEIHCLRKHDKTYSLDFLPYHYLLTSIGQTGWIKWHDVSTGTYINGYGTGHGPCKVLRHNPQNAVSICGHNNGIITLWSPSNNKALVSMFCHKSPVTDLAVDREGYYLTTAGLDGMLKIWDLRKYQLLHAYKPDQPVMTVDVSDRNLLAIGLGRQVQILKNAFTTPTDITYLKHEIRTPNRSLCAGAGAVASMKSLLSSVAVTSVRFRPYEDSLVIGHSHGVTSIVVPGAGEPNFDSFEANPFINQKQRREDEVQTLLNKLSPDMIAIDSEFIATVDKDTIQLAKEQNEIFYGANQTLMGKDKKKIRNKMRGKNKISKKLKIKYKNIIEEQHEKATQAATTAATNNTNTKDNNTKKKSNMKSNELTTNTSSNTVIQEFNPLHRFMPSK